MYQIDWGKSRKAYPGCQSFFGSERTNQPFFLRMMPSFSICLISRERCCGVRASNWATSQCFRGIGNLIALSVMPVFWFWTISLRNFSRRCLPERQHLSLMLITLEYTSLLKIIVTHRESCEFVSIACRNFSSGTKHNLHLVTVSAVEA